MVVSTFINNQSVDMIKPQDYSVGDYEVEYYYTDISTLYVAQQRKIY